MHAGSCCAAAMFAQSAANSPPACMLEIISYVITDKSTYLCSHIKHLLASQLCQPCSHDCFGSCSELAVDMLLTKHHAVITHVHAQQASIRHHQPCTKIVEQMLCFLSDNTKALCHITGQKQHSTNPSSGDWQFDSELRELCVLSGNWQFDCP